jgi:hypothetical protein
MHCGIEFEYLIFDTDGPERGRIRDFTNLPFADIRPLLAAKPGLGDPELATGDLGIKSGYWYLEGDERFHPDGTFRTLEVKGVEIRTPPAEGVEQAVSHLLRIEAQLHNLLSYHGLGLGIVGFNPVRAGYNFSPPLNAWEKTLRRENRAYDGSQVTTLSYGPDINLSMPGWTTAQNLEAARKLCAYAPYVVPFSFSSPFFGGDLWSGCSKRTFERAPRRPAVKLFVSPAQLAACSHESALVHRARVPREVGRIEFKAFDAMPSVDVLTACCHLLVGICLAPDLPARSEQADLDLYRRCALAAFDDEDIHRGASLVLQKAKAALRRAGAGEAAAALAPLEMMLAARRTPSHDLVADYARSGLMYRPGGFVWQIRQEDCHYA